MIDETVFSKDDLIAFLRNNYNIFADNIIKINNGSANIYKICTKEKKYILKEFQSKYNYDIVLREFNVLNFLKKTGVPVPNYVIGIDGQLYFEYKKRIIIVQDYIDGYTKNYNQGDILELLESAKYLALIVNCLEDYHNEDLKKYSFQSEELLRSLKKAKSNNDDLILRAKKDLKKGQYIIDDLMDRSKIINYILDSGIYKEICDISYKNTHGDYNVSQFIYKNHKIIAILDFVNASNLPIVYEIMRSYAYIDKECVDGVMNINNLILYIEEYMKYSKLNINDLKYMPYIYLIFLIKSTYGYEEFLNTDNFRVLKNGKRRTNIARYLYKNASIISERLVNYFSMLWY